MRNRLNGLVFKKPPRGRRKVFLNDKVVETTGSLHYHLGIPLECGPCYQFTRQTLSWQKGWLTTSAFYEGHQAGMEGKTMSDNPYARNFTGAPGDIGLAEEWRRGYRAGYTATKT